MEAVAVHEVAEAAVAVVAAEAVSAAAIVVTFFFSSRLNKIMSQLMRLTQ